MTMMPMLTRIPGPRILATLLASVLLVAACQLATPTASPAPTEVATTSPTATASPPASAVSSPSPSPSPNESAFVSHSVVAGDTLFGIARAYDSTWQSIVFWNKDRYASLDPDDPSYDPGRIEIGWVLLVQPGVVVQYEPGPGATARPTAEPTPTAPPSIAVRNGDRTSHLVALTFDMGGRVDPAVEVMELLIANDVKATVFMTGAIIDSTNTDLGRAVLALMDGHRGLFELGNHSYTHRDFRTLSDAQIATELQGMEQAVATRSTRSPRPLFRPPYGGYDARVLAAVGANGYTHTIMWDIDSIDWRPESDGGPTTEQIVAKVRDSVRGGSIVLFHLGGYNTLAALPGVLDVLAQKGLTPATVSEVIGP